jgi:large-conductance mechanosensitive channel
MSAFANSFKDFIMQNGIIPVAASITIGFATATFVKSFVSDLFMPAIFMVIANSIGRMSPAMSTFVTKFLSAKQFGFMHFVSELITWILIVLAAFLILDLVVRKYFVKNTPPSPAPSQIMNPFKPVTAAPTPTVTVPTATAPMMMPPSPVVMAPSPMMQHQGAVKEEYMPSSAMIDNNYALF